MLERTLFSLHNNIREVQHLTELSFDRRFGFDASKPITDRFPDEARTELAYLLKDLVEGHKVGGWSNVHNELCRTGCLTETTDPPFFAGTMKLLDQLDGRKVYVFCERAYRRLLKPVGR